MTDLTLDRPTRSSTDVAREHSETLFPCVAPYYREPIVPTRASGVWLDDIEGRQYLDFFGGILTTGIGHCHPEVVDAIQQQVARLGHVSSLYLNEPQIEAGRLLADMAPGDLDRVLFTNSGTEAVETAILLACQHTQRTEVVTLRLAYSGRSVLSTNLTAIAAWRPLPSTVAGIKHTLAPYPYRCPFCKGPCEGDCSDAFADDLVDLIETTTTGKPAAFIAETILGVGGFIVPPPTYFKKAAEIIRDYGGLFISDEVQAGFGRTGSHWFGIEHWGVVPDILVTAKSIANGLPVAATVTRAEIAASWTAKTISTFGGNPLTMAGCSATLKVMQREDTRARSAERGTQLRAGLDALTERYDWIGEARGMGLMQGLELVDNGVARNPDQKRAQALLEATKAEGLLIGLGGRFGHVVRIGPSMLISESEVADGLGRLERACARVAETS